MPAFRDALTDAQIGKVIQCLRGFCCERQLRYWLRALSVAFLFLVLHFDISEQGVQRTQSALSLSRQALLFRSAPEKNPLWSGIVALKDFTSLANGTPTVHVVCNFWSLIFSGNKRPNSNR